MTLEEKFIKYVKIDTQSEDESPLTPSTLKQFELANLLCAELKSYGIENAHVTDKCLVYASIEGNPAKKKIGLIAHMDTATELQGGNFEPRIIENYDGKDIKLNDKYTLSPSSFPSLNNEKGCKLIVTDGEHLLGGDDKAGIAIIMEIAQYYASHKEKEHAPIRICFTPDEEVGRGPDNFSVKEMDADFAYTLDGGSWTDVEYENFNAYSVHIEIEGVSIHPGSAKGIMVNASLIASEFISLLPEDEVPSRTEGYEGFNHLCGIQGGVDHAEMYYIVRNHDNSKALKQLKEFDDIRKKLVEKYPSAGIKVTSKLQYRNMKECFKDDMSVIDKITRAIEKAGGKVTYTPIRGGTDGATITFMGLPCPNIGNGDRNCHGRYEYVVVDEMYKMTEAIKNLLEE